MGWMTGNLYDDLLVTTATLQGSQHQGDPVDRGFHILRCLSAHTSILEAGRRAQQTDTCLALEASELPAMEDVELETISITVDPCGLLYR